MADENEHGKFSSRIKKALDAAKAKARKFFDEADWIFGRRTVRVLCAVALFAIVVALLLVFLHWYIAPNKPGERKDLVLAVAQILAGTALLSGLYFTWRTLQVNREGQITERFTRAIDQLGNDTLEVRIGGINALESIARESEHHYWPIVEVMTAYVRTRTSQSREEGPNSVGNSEPVKDRTHQHRSADVQAALYMLANRNHALDPGGNKFINLSGTDLRNADLRDTHLEKARLRGTDLTDAILRGACFQSATLTNAILDGAELHPSNFEDADLGRAHLEKADLEGAVLKRADLGGADLRDARGATKERLEAQAKTLEGATMPDGSKHD